VARTLVVSDLHLGTRAGSDVLRREGVLEALLEALEGVDRLVLLGDTLELRQGQSRVVLDRACTVLRRLGECLGERSVVLVPGNHDHALVDFWLQRRSEPLGLDQRCAPSEASFLAQVTAELLAPAAVEIAYPGLWLGEGVYAMHGHQLDMHMTVPTIERLAVAASGRISLANDRRWDDVHSVRPPRAGARRRRSTVDAPSRPGTRCAPHAGARCAPAPSRSPFRGWSARPTRPALGRCVASFRPPSCAAPACVQ
jgi:hypothetical protein